MAHLDLEEQEQLAQLKSWWASWGSPILTGVLVVVLAFSGWQGWRWWKASQSTGASTLYESLSRATQGRDAKAVRDASGELLEKYPGTAYASMGALTSARFFFDKGDLKAARVQLQWVIEHTGLDEYRDLARLRLANVLLDENNADEALKQLDEKHGAAFEAQFALLRGDILVAKKQAAQARAAYTLALEKSDPKDSGFRDGIQMRLDALGG